MGGREGEGGNENSVLTDGAAADLRARQVRRLCYSLVVAWIKSEPAWIAVGSITT